MRSKGHSLTGLLLTLLLGGCVIGPIPEPPQATIDPDRLYWNDPTHRGVGLASDPGAASPPGAVVRAYRLDVDEAPAEAVVADNGSFLFDVPFELGDEVRLQILTDEARGVPVDVIISEDAARPRPAERALAHCLLLDPPLELRLDADGRGAVEVVNDCEHEVELAPPALRRALPSVDVGAELTWPATLPAGGRLSVDVVAPDLTPADEDLFFIEVTRPVTDRRPVTMVPQ